jgi:hypothetical protein
VRIAFSLYVLGFAAELRADFAEARGFLEESIAIDYALGAASLAAILLELRALRGEVRL